MTTLAVIDDDPTGAQTQAGVVLVLEWSPQTLGSLAGERAGAIHILTNSRALDADAAYGAVRDAAAAAAKEWPRRWVVLRGDSTLRGHLLPEYLGVRDAVFSRREPPLVLIPALPAAGRVTVDGVHWLVRDGRRIRLDQTEYARDSHFTYTTSRLLDWAHERSSGHFDAADGRELHLKALRAGDGAAAVAATLGELAVSGRPAVFAPDAETVGDLEIIARGLRDAHDRGIETIVRCAPAFVGVAAGTTAPALTPVLPVQRGVLVVVGSHVPLTTRQLQHLVARRPGALIEVDPAVLASSTPEDEIETAVSAARSRLAEQRLAVVATHREISRALLTPDSGVRIARGLARVLAGAHDAADVIVSKGGITSAINVREGLGATKVLVAGPVSDGIALWRVPAPSGPADLIVFPGNVGDDVALADLVDRLLGA